MWFRKELSSLAEVSLYLCCLFMWLLYSQITSQIIGPILISFVALGMRSEGNVPKNGEPSVRFHCTTMIHDTGRFVNEFLSYHSYSPTMTAANLYPFPGLKSKFKGLFFYGVTDVIENATKELKRHSQNGLQKCFQHLYHRWQKFIVAQGDCFAANVAHMIVLFLLLLLFM